MKFSRTFLIGIIAALLVAITIISIANFIESDFDGKFASGTKIAGLDISGKMQEEAKKNLKTAAANYLEKSLNLNLLGKTKTVRLKELGLEIYSDETIDTLKQNPSAKLALRIDSEKLLSSLRKIFEFEKLEAKSASFAFDQKGNLTINEGQAGLTLNQQDLAKRLKILAQNFTIRDLEVTTLQQQPLVNKAALESQQEEIKAQLKHSFTLMDPVYTGNWDLKLQDNLDWIKFSQKEEITIPYLNKNIFTEPSGFTFGKIRVYIEINEDKLNEFIDTKVSKWLDRPAEPVKIFTDKKGKVLIRGKGSSGKMVQRRKLKHAIELAVAHRIKKVPIPVVDIEPTVDISADLQAKGVKEIISVGHTSYYGSPKNRVHNIKTGAARYNSLLLAPDEIFSFNEKLGAVDGSTGFLKELVIKQEGTIPEYGGGICQVSTTMYRAGLLAGLPIVERNQHSYAVSYYSQILGHGLDATIYLGGPNLKFKNDTKNHLLIQTYTVNDYELYIVFYGTKDGRKVEMEGPYLSSHTKPGPTLYIETPDLSPGEEKQVEKSHAGFNALWYRYLTDASGKQTKEEIKTHYKAIPAKILKGIATPVIANPQALKN